MYLCILFAIFSLSRMHKNSQYIRIFTKPRTFMHSSINKNLLYLALVTINTSVILCIFHLFLLAVRVSFGCTWMHKNSLSSVPSLHVRSPCRSLKYGSPVGSNSIDRSQRRFLSVYRKWRGVPGPLRPARARVDRNYAVISPRSTAL